MNSQAPSNWHVVYAQGNGVRMGGGGCRENGPGVWVGWGGGDSTGS